MLIYNRGLLVMNRIGPSLQRHVRFTSTVATTKTTTTTTTAAEDTYQRALQAFQQANALKEVLQEKRNRLQFEAWERSKEGNKNPISGGVAVVRTIAKQHRKVDPDQEQHDRVLKEAHELLSQAAEQGHVTALVRLGNAALKAQDPTNALSYYQKAKSAEAYFNIGHLLWTGLDNVLEPDQKAAMEAFQKAIELGDADAMYFCGVQFLASQDGNDLQRGLALIQQAGDQGHSGALYYIAVLHLNGNSDLNIEACSPEEFARRLDQAAEAGDMEALFLRGHCFYHGDNGFKQSYKKALENFLQAADLGHADAAVSAGAMLHQGVGVARNQPKAFELYQVAGELGSVEGWRNVVACYATGEGVKQSKETAEYIAKTMLKNED